MTLSRLHYIICVSHVIHFIPVVISLEFRCNGSGEARVDVTVAVSNRTHRGYHNNIATLHTFSLTKRCGECHGNGGMPGNDHISCDLFAVDYCMLSWQICKVKCTPFV